MKKIILIFMLFSTIVVKAQENKHITVRENLRIAHINEEATIHFRSPERIEYIDISGNENIIGDLPADNIGRIKLIKDSIARKNGEDIGIVTIVGENYMAQYRLIYNSNIQKGATNIAVLPVDMQPTEFPDVELSLLELRQYCMKIQSKSPELKNLVAKAMGLIGRINNIYCFGNYIFVDVSYKNKTNLKYDIDDIRFYIEDKKIYKATNNQMIEIEPIYSLYKKEVFRRNFRNIYVFKKFTFPNNKIFKIRITEKQISGRELDLLIEYRNLLNADTF